MRRGLTLGALAVAAAVSLAIAGALPGSAAASSFVSTAGCQEHQAFVAGDDAAVAPRLPKRYTPVRDPSSGRPLLFVRAIRCAAITVDGRTGPATMGNFGVVVDSPDGRGCASGAPAAGSVKGDAVPACNWYPLFWAADDPRVVEWLRHGTPGFPAILVPGLRFELAPPAFHFEAPAPTPSPFSIDAAVHPRPGEIPIRGGYWADTPRGTVKIAFSTDDLTSGDASGVVHAMPGSQMAAMFGADEGSYVPGYSLFAGERWGHAAYRKQLIGAPAADEELHSFDGSCSLQGDVRFTPPANDEQALLGYAYDSKGTCSGTLDGRAVSDAPVALRHSGQAYASCERAQSTTPGQGEIAFAGGPVLPYTLDFTGTLTDDSFTFYGERSGTAGGDGSFLTQRTSPDTPLSCGGDGLARAPQDLSLTTDGPLVVAAQRRRAPVLGLSVRPRRVRVGRRTRLAFLVTGGDGRAVPGAAVRFAGRRAVSDQAGRARIVVSLRRRGQRAAAVTKPGFAGGRIMIRAR